MAPMNPIENLQMNPLAMLPNLPPMPPSFNQSQEHLEPPQEEEIDPDMLPYNPQHNNSRPTHNLGNTYHNEAPSKMSSLQEILKNKRAREKVDIESDVAYISLNGNGNGNGQSGPMPPPARPEVPTSSWSSGPPMPPMPPTASSSAHSNHESKTEGPGNGFALPPMPPTNLSTKNVKVAPVVMDHGHQKREEEETKISPVSPAENPFSNKGVASTG